VRINEGISKDKRKYEVKGNEIMNLKMTQG